MAVIFNIALQEHDAIKNYVHQHVMTKHDLSQFYLDLQLQLSQAQGRPKWSTVNDLGGGGKKSEINFSSRTSF